MPPRLGSISPPPPARPLNFNLKLINKTAQNATKSIQQIAKWCCNVQCHSNLRADHKNDENLCKGLSVRLVEAAHSGKNCTVGGQKQKW